MEMGPALGARTNVSFWITDSESQDERLIYFGPFRQEMPPDVRTPNEREVYKWKPKVAYIVACAVVSVIFIIFVVITFIREQCCQTCLYWKKKNQDVLPPSSFLGAGLIE
jgi:hypothetical protein